MQIHETAFIISTYRSYHEDISLDPYARLWNNEDTETIIPDILKNVSEHETILHSIRNRFFNDQLTAFFKKHNGGTLINFGAGFSMYQFVLPDTVNTIEIDKKDILDYKKRKVNTWTKEGKLPKRNIEYVSLDFNNKTKEEITNTIKPLLKKSPTFIVLEGVLFFLDQNTTNKLFEAFNAIQNKGDLAGSVSYIPEIENSNVYKKLLHYFNSNNDTNDSFSHQTIPHEYYKQLKGYSLKQNTNEYDLSKTYSPELHIADPTQILNEHLYILEKE